MQTKNNSQEAVWCIAHRGARDEAPENTDAAFQRALAYPIDGIELDVQMSADGVPVIYHDRTLLRVTGRRKAVSNLDYARLTQLNWGGWYHRDFKHEPLLTLEQVLEHYGGHTRLMVEIKSRPADQASGHSVRLTREVLRLLDQHSTRLADSQIFLLSFDERILHLAHQLDPRWPCVLNLSGKQLNDFRTAARNRPEAEPVVRTDSLWAVDVAIRYLSTELVGLARSRGLRVFTYTCNGPRRLRKALNLGVDAILSDRPGWLTQQVKKKSELF